MVREIFLFAWVVGSYVRAFAGLGWGGGGGKGLSAATGSGRTAD